MERLERDYLYCQALASVLREAGPTFDLGSAVEMTHLRTDVTRAGGLELPGGDVVVTAVFGDGSGRQTEPDLEPLWKIVTTLNERFGLNLTDQDQLLFDQYEREWLGDEEIVDQARNNSLDNFKLVFDRNFLKTVIGRMDENDAIFRRILDDEDFQQTVRDFYGKEVYRKARQERGSTNGEGGR